MKFRGLIVIILIAGALTAGLRAPAETPELSVLTANVGNMQTSKADYYRQFKISEYDLPVLKDNLKRAAPDVIFLQELDGKGMAQQKRVFTDKYEARCEGELCIGLRGGALGFAGGCEQKNGYLICTAFFPNRKPLPEKCSLQKGEYVCTTKRTLKKDEIVKLINVHTASPADDKSFGLRRAQICGMLKEASALRRKGMNVIIGGDFNFDPWVYESAAYNKNNKKDDLFQLGVCWRDNVGDPDSEGLKLITTDEPTWATKEVKMVFMSKQVHRTMDHVITTFKGAGCDVLSDEKDRLDVDRTGVSKPRDMFMDHRAVVCRVKTGG